MPRRANAYALFEQEGAGARDRLQQIQIAKGKWMRLRAVYLKKTA